MNPISLIIRCVAGEFLSLCQHAVYGIPASLTPVEPFRQWPN